VAVFAALRRPGEPCFFFESARGGPRIARYSFVGASPSRSIVDVGGQLSFSPARRERHRDIFDAIRTDCRAARAIRAPGLPRFAGGWVGFAGWDIARGAVGLPRRRPDEDPPADGLPDAV